MAAKVVTAEEAEGAAKEEEAEQVLSSFLSFFRFFSIIIVRVLAPSTDFFSFSDT